MDTLIHQRVRLANEGKNPTAIRKMQSGWLVLGDNQKLRGYSLLLSDPVALDLNSLDLDARSTFLTEMALIGDALLEATGAYLINYSILGNLDHALHAHIHPRYPDEPDEYRQRPPWAYRGQNEPFDLVRDGELMGRICGEIDRRIGR